MADQGDHHMEGVEEHQVADKGKGKAPSVEEPMQEDDSSEESGAEEVEAEAETVEEEEEFDEIDPSNIVASRTRGVAIDYSKAAQDLPPEDDEDEDDDDYQGEGDDAMEE
ncbi:hypothetical protein M011DRAFT_471801 [Sporormia fimetaria CBS 119925]|uniref:Histone chaperone domain-containing protein n=1 Tax=Sporormia fimetaria CBS 119925 TaxID=1340428 RepID=A0A6A6UZJ7_9PLEO|nr:hypothetical protein M011DRAFT_471801 [Sporormia fimetaria CBS 119925]